jgi:exopolysaccharide biosynthesis predicted pyruvyltransferase EpsI
MNTSYHLHLMRRFLETFRGEEILYFPNPGNAGDSLIAAGTYQALRRAGIRFSILQPGQNVTGRTVFLGGGGNLVPLYRECRDVLEAVLPSAGRIVVLPHTIRGNEDLLAHIDHRATVFCRDPQSYWHVLQHCRADVRLDHDMAFHLNVDDFFTQCIEYREMPAVFAKRVESVPALRARQRGSLAFMREDGEKRENRPGIESVLDLSTAFEFGVVPDTAEKSVWCMFQAIKRSTECTTDRLHVAISCALLDHPCRLFDNNYGKNSGIYLHSMRRFSSAVTLVS